MIEQNFKNLSKFEGQKTDTEKINKCFMWN